MKIVPRTLMVMLITIILFSTLGVGVLAEDQGYPVNTNKAILLDRYFNNEDPFTFFKDLQTEEQNLLMENVTGELNIETRVTITEERLRSSTAITVTVNGYYFGVPVWQHNYRIEWTYDGVYINSWSGTSWGNGGGAGAWSWIYAGYQDGEVLDGTGQTLLGTSIGDIITKFLGVQVDETYPTIVIAAYGDGSYDVY